jgi:PleD family two-component response regulator
VQNLFMAGADDYVAKPVVSAELVVRITNRLERLRLLQSLSTKDALTGLANYSQSARSLTSLFHDHSTAYFVLLVWPDLRKMTLHDGHPKSHHVLRQWGQLLRSHFTAPAIIGYWGNGDFVMGLPQMDGLDVQDRVHNLIEILQEQGIETLEPETESVLLSCQWAIVEYPKHGETLQSLYQTAYQRLIDA